MGPVQIMTEGGAAQAELDGDRAAARFLLVLTHGAGGTVGAPDLLAARDAGLQSGGMVARVTQPYRVRGARAPGSAVRQDTAWAEVVSALRELAPGAPDAVRLHDARHHPARLEPGVTSCQQVGRADGAA